MPTQKSQDKFALIKFLVIVLFIAFSISPVLGLILIIALVIFWKYRPKFLEPFVDNLLPMMFNSRINLTASEPAVLSGDDPDSLGENEILIQEVISSRKTVRPNFSSGLSGGQKKLQRRKKYLQIALNSTLDEARGIIYQLPASERIIIEAGTPLIKEYGSAAISQIKSWAPAGAYIVADNKCADLGAREVGIMAEAGADAATCLGVAPIETIDSFISECQKYGIDSMIDMMNVENSLAVLKKLKKLPDVVILHRGVDESEFSKEKQIPYYQIKQIKGSYNILVAVAGGDTIKEAQRAIFNDADIVVVWKNFYQSNNETARLAESFLKEVK